MSAVISSGSSLWKCQLWLVLKAWNRATNVVKRTYHVARFARSFNKSGLAYGWAQALVGAVVGERPDGCLHGDARDIGGVEQLVGTSTSRVLAGFPPVE